MTLKVRAAAAGAALLLLPWLGGTTHAGVVQAHSFPGPAALPETAAIAAPAVMTAPPGDFFTLPVEVQGLTPCRDGNLPPSLTVTYPASWSLLTPGQAVETRPPNNVPADGPWNGEGTVRHTAPVSFPEGDEAPVHFFTFYVPGTTPAGAYPVRIQLSAPERARFEGVAAVPAQGDRSHKAEVTVQVPPRVRLAAEPLPPVEGYRGEPVTVPLRLRNDGNVPLSVSLIPRFPRGWAWAAPEPSLGRGEGKEADADTAPAFIPPDAAIDVPVAVAVPPHAAFGDYPFQIDVHAVPASRDDDAAAGTIDEDASVSMRVRGHVTVLPPDPPRVPRAPARAPAALHADWSASISPSSAGGGPSPRRVQAGLETFFPGTPPTGRLRLVWESYTDPWGTAVRPLHVTDLDYVHPRDGWRLRRWTPSLADTLLARPQPALQWQSRRWGLAVPMPAAPPSNHVPSSSATVTWRPAPDVLPVAVSHRFGSSQGAPASEVTVGWAPLPELTARIHGAFGRSRPGWSAHLTWASVPGGASPSPASQPHWRAEARGYVVPSELAPSGAPLREVGGTVERVVSSSTVGVSLWHGFVPVPASLASLDPSWDRERWPLSVPLWKAGVRLSGPLGRSGPPYLHGQVEWARTAPGSPVPSAAAPLLSGPLAPRDDVYGSVRAAWGRHRLLARSRWYRQGPTQAWEHGLSWRQTTGGRGWWQLTAVREGRRTDRPPSGMASPPQWREGWSVSVQGGWRDAAGRRWTGGIRWTFPDEGAKPRTQWQLAVAQPRPSGWEWRIGIGGGDPLTEGRLDVRAGVTYRFPLPWPGPNPSFGYVEGRIVIPASEPMERTSMAGAVVRLGHERVSTDEFGRFRFPPLPPGTYELVMERLPLPVAADTAAPEPAVLTVRAGETERVDIALVLRGHIVGRVTPPAATSPAPRPLAPAPPAPAAAGSPGEGSLVHLRLVDEEGTVVAQRWVEPGTPFHFPRLVPGPYRLEATTVTVATAAASVGSAAACCGAFAPAARRAVTAVMVAAGETTVVNVSVPVPEEEGPPVTFQGEATWPPPHPAGARRSQ